MKPRLVDISPVISPQIGVFPGDVPFKRSTSLDFKNGDHLLLSSIESTLHLGAHTDGPNHYDPNGCGIAEVDLKRYIGTCLVLHAEVPRGERVRREHLSPEYRNAKHWPCRRILVRTNSFPDPDSWNSDFCSLSPELIEDWALSGVVLVGIDTPSVDPETSKDLQAHRTVARYGLSILEGVILGEVSEGIYQLIALPLRISGADAAPVRAVLIENFAGPLDIE